MSKLQNAQPGCDGVIEYPSSFERDAALDGLTRLRPELQLAPAGETWLAWRWPHLTDGHTAEAARHLALVDAARDISKRHAGMIAVAMANPGEEVELMKNSWTKCSGLYHAVRDAWATHGLTVRYDPETNPTTVFVTYTS